MIRPLVYNQSILRICVLRNEMEMQMIEKILFFDIKVSMKEKVNVTEKSFEVHRVLVSFIITTYSSIRKPMLKLVFKKINLKSYFSDYVGCICY